ncbi:MAG TPA: recombinase family protein [Ktedonobacteraceae bacterium]|nr:recombinase family protein [Ktedonobacteraceae bacterium]
MTTIVDIYCRVSTDDQENNTSLEGQEAEGRAYAREQGFIVGEVHKEVYSGFKYRERKKLEYMRSRYRDGKIQGVVIRTLDRLSRAQAHVSILLEEMDFYGVTLHSVKENIDNTPMGKFSRMVLAHFAEMEREKILDRTMTGRVNKAKEGKIVSGRKLSYGWKWHDEAAKDYVMLDEEKADILRKAGEEYADGATFHAIINRFNAEGILPPEGKVWYPNALRRLLTDPRITGKNLKIFEKGTRGKQVKEKLEPVDLPDGTYPAILSEELYQRILERASMNIRFSQRNAQAPEAFLLRAGFLRCARCKRLMAAVASNKRELKNDGSGEYYTWVMTYYKCANPQCPANFQMSSKSFDDEI